ncbi:putative membrane associated signal transduction histidine kinase [Algoriphagus machipongonensis]|uniref:histidine kinase n=1 Tax=Algoriphagus machipongonensis TaxID=388413 RepID=A3I349_9BACT|nr:putative membrane associated signal transduction histidine kinase [Algoriphagus machipongonensis]
MEAQQILNVDSLKSILPNKEGKERIFTLNLLATNLRESEQQQALDFAKEAEALAISLNDTAGESLAKENIGWVYYRKGRYEEAFQYSKEAYDLAVEVNDMNVAARLMNSMGALFYEQRNYDQAIEQFQTAYEISKENDDLFTEIRSLNNIAFIYSQKQVYDSALYYAKLSKKQNEDAGSPYLSSFSNRVIGDVFFARGNYDSAQMVFEESLETAQKQNALTTEASITHRLGGTYLKLNKLKEAKEILTKGIQISKENGFLDELAQNHKYLSDYYVQIGDIKNAFDQQSIYLVLNDSLVNSGNRDRLALMQGMFQESLDQTELKLLKEQNESQAQRLALTRRNNWIIAIAIISIVSLAIWLLILNRNIKKYNKFLVEQKEKIKDQNKDLETKSFELASINETKNKLFSILGHDLKGPVAQVKSVLDLIAQGALSKEEFEELLDSLKTDIDTVHFTLNNTLKWSMSQMEGFKIKKSPFNFREVVDANLVLIEPSLKEKKIQVDNRMDDSVPVFADSDLMDVVVRNILNNAVKFSKKNESIEITNSCEKDMIKWCVQDHGLGMTDAQIETVLSKDYTITQSQKGTNQEKGSGLGLQLCKEFIRMNGGDITIQSEKKKGTKVCVTIPIKGSQGQSQVIHRKEVFQS